MRFGNVLGSRGSVLHAFADQIERGGPVTVTDPEVTRYFMTIPEACQLVIQAGALGEPGQALVLDMGEPVKVLDVARRMISMAGKRAEIVFTGLRPGEKLHEERMAHDETDERPRHPLISHVPVDAIDLDRVAALPVTGRRSDVSEAMARACTDELGTADLPRLYDDMEETVVHSRD